MNKEQSLEILESAKRRIIGMSEEEKNQIAIKIDAYCDESSLKGDSYNRTKFSLINSYEVFMVSGSYDINSKEYRGSDIYINNGEFNECNLIVEAA